MSLSTEEKQARKRKYNHTYASTSEAKAKRRVYDEGRRELKREYDRVYRRERWTPEMERNSYLKKTFGLTLEQYNKLLESQGGLCKICCNPPSSKMSLGVDHDHACCPGKKSCGACIRGLLCQQCNSFLGRIADNPARLIAYLGGEEAQCLSS